MLKSKYVLLTVALFCVTDCALVLGELILDLHRVKDTLETSERLIYDFKATLHQTYPSHITDVDTDIRNVFSMIAKSRIVWDDTKGSENNSNPTSTSKTVPSTFETNSSVHGGSTSFGRIITSPAHSVVSLRHHKDERKYSKKETEYIVVYEEERQRSNGNKSISLETAKQRVEREQHTHSLEEEIAHALHLTSITLMAILVFETMLKAICAGLPFFKRKLETFDLFIVAVSFLVDIVFMQILPRFKIQDFVFILAFLLPWRVIRVVNSLVVAVQDHEHFRLKLLYSRKKKIQNNLREAEVKLQLFKAQCCALKRLCLNEGVDEHKIEQIVQLDEYVVSTYQCLQKSTF